MWLPVLILVFFTSVQCYNILGLFPHPGKSHFDAFEPLMKGLALKGHNVTVISHFPQKKLLERFADVSLSGTETPYIECFAFQDLPQGRLVKYYEPIFLARIGRESCKKAFESTKLLDFLKTEARFDLIIAEFFNSDCLLGFVHKFKTPLIGIGSNSLMSWMNMRFGNIDHPAYVPNNFLDHTDDLSFWERVENTLMNIFSQFAYYYLIEKPTYEIVKPYFGEDLPRLSDIAFNASLMMTNTHFSLSRPRPLVPNVIDVAGMHIGNAKSLGQVMTLY